MLYPTLSQPLVFLYMFIAGIIGGIVYGFVIALSKIIKTNRVLKQILIFFATAACSVLFWIVNLEINYGQFRIYTLLTYACAIVLERITVGKGFAILLQRCYNIINGRKQKKKTD